MSHIPNSAMPHAAPNPEGDTGTMEKPSPSLSERAGKLADKARGHPKTVAAGAALVAGAIAAAAIPAVRAARRKSGGKTKSRGSRKDS